MFAELKPGDRIKIDDRTVDVVGHPKPVPDSTLASVMVTYLNPRSYESSTRWKLTRWKHDEITLTP